VHQFFGAMSARGCDIIRIVVAQWNSSGVAAEQRENSSVPLRNDRHGEERMESPAIAPHLPDRMAMPIEGAAK
jgi:hypothetical protein